MEFLFLFISLASGAIVGHATSMQEKSLGSIGNIATGAIGGGFGWIILKWLGWYTGESELFGWQISAMLGYMVLSAVTGGILIILTAFFRRII